MLKISQKHLLNSTLDRLSMETVRIGRVFLLITGLGLTLVSLMIIQDDPLLVPDMGVRYIISATCFLVMGLSYLPKLALSHKTNLIRIGVGMFVLYDCLITYILEFGYLTIIGLLTVVAAGMIAFSYGRMLWLYTLSCLVLIGTLLIISNNLDVVFRVYFAITFSCLIVFSFILARGRERFNAELIRNETEANLNKRILTSVVESSSDMIWSVDTNNSLVTFNQAFQLFYQAIWNKTPFAGQNFGKDEFPFPIASGNDFHWKEVWQGQHQALDIQLSIVSSTPIWMQLSLNPILDGHEIQGYSGFAKNISEIKRKSARLHFLKKAIENSGEAIAVIRQDSHFEFVNQAFIRLTHIQPGVSTHSLANQVIEKQALLDGFILGLQQRTWTGILTLPQPGGNKLLVRARIDGMVDDNHQSVGATISLVDITEITETQALLAGVLNSGLDGIMAFRSVRDKNGKIIDFQWIMSNSSANNMVGRSDLIGKLLLTEMPGNKTDGLYDKYVEVVETGQSISFQQSYGHEFVKNIWFRISAVKLGDGFAVTFSDIADQKKREAELQKLSLVASKSNTGVLIADHQGVIEWVNESYSRITGIEATEIVGTRPGLNLLGAEANNLIMGSTLAMEEVIRTNKPFSGEVMNYRPDGEGYWLAMNINPIFNEKGTATDFIAICTDVSIRKQAEKQLRLAKESAEQADKAKSDFLATMSHEIRTPMNAVIGLTSLLLETNLDYEQREYIETIRISGDNLLALINEILDFSKIESGKLTLESQPFSLQDLIEETFDLLAPKAAISGLELIQEIDHTLPELIQTDPNRLRQVLVNLVGNAIKFTREGEVSVFVRKNWMSDDQVLLQFEVRDTGIGISEAKKHLLFKPFSQLDASITRKYGGTGLGLAICKRLVNLMSGEIWVDSEENRGTSFFFTIQAGVIRRVLQPLSFPAKEILVITENATQNHVLTQQLRFWGLNTMGATHLRAIREKIQPWPKFDLIVADFGIKGFSGETLVRELQGVYGQETPLVLLDRMGGRKKNLNLPGTLAWINKPIRRKELQEALIRFFPSDLPESLSASITISENGEKMPPLQILLVEDNPINQKVAIRLLHRLGYRADVVSNGIEALMNVASRPYDLVLMDVQMPEMDGLTATRRLRESHGKEKPVIIAMTANALEGDRQLCLDAGMNDYLSKPVKLENLRDAILRWFEPMVVSS